ncbi:hypothetical protein [Streptomyces sp. MP131-18]|uniref:hypothetical protein n=1 Tax=Streptomyces sp. MP131-18 TaxID=1857892 RepID=UPI00097CAC94|nr:hypothetical protein [Streptomyces sp. MP131-18]ONK15987.1 hypothetical protein STBA_68370 [Streptomyces sp. MP131-18]
MPNEPETDIDADESLRTDEEMENESEEEVESNTETFYQQYAAEIEEMRRALQPLLDDLDVRFQDTIDLDNLDAEPQTLDESTETINGGMTDELKRMVDEAVRQRMDDLGLQKRKGRLWSRVKGWQFALAVWGALGGTLTVTMAVINFVLDRKKAGRGEGPRDTGPGEGSQLTDEQKAKVEAQLERWWALDDGQVWARVAEQVDRRNPSLQGQILLLSTIKLFAADLPTPFVWDSAGDKAAAVNSCVAAYNSPGAAANSKSRALYDFAGAYRYQGEPIPRQVMADVVELALYQIIVARPKMTGPRLHFPDQPRTVDARLYASRYLGRARRGERLLYRHKPQHLRGVLTRRTGRLPVFSPEQVEDWLRKLPDDKQQQVRASMAAALPQWRRNYPLLRGEEITEERITALSDLWKGNEKYTLVYTRNAGPAALAVVAQGCSVDPESGTYRCLERSAASSRPGTPAVGDGTLDIVEQCLNTLGQIAFTCGPEGQVVGAAALILNTILSVGFGQSQVNLPKVIDDIMKQDLAEDHIYQDMTHLLTYTSWIAEQAEAAIENDYDYKQGQAYEETLADIKTSVKNALEPNFPLLQTISDLQNGEYPSDPEFQLMALPVLLVGISIHLLYLQISILLSNDATTFKSPATVYLVNAAKDYLAHLQDKVGTISDRYAQRMDASHTAIGETTFTHCAGIQCGDEHIIFFQDWNTSQYPQRESLPLPESGESNLVWYAYCDSEKGGGWDCPSGDAQSAYTDYWQGVDTDFRNHYNYSSKRQDDLSQAIASVQAIIDRYEPLLGG